MGCGSSSEEAPPLPKKNVEAPKSAEASKPAEAPKQVVEIPKKLDATTSIPKPTVPSMTVGSKVPGLPSMTSSLKKTAENSVKEADKVPPPPEDKSASVKKESAKAPGIVEPESKQGFLNKQGRGAVKSWKKRWFVLEKGSLRYFVDADKKDQKGEVLLQGMVARTGDTYIYVEANVDGADKDVILDVNLDADRQSWLECIQKHIDFANKTKK
jgi:hypothetical protein